MKDRIKKLNRLFLLIPVGLFAMAIVLDLNLVSGFIDESFIGFTREWFIILAFGLSLPLVYYQKWASDRNALRGLRFLFFLVIFTYIAILVSRGNFTRLAGDFSEIQSIYSSFAVYLFVMSWAFFLTIFVLLSLGTLRNLIFIKQKKSTSRNFNLLITGLFIYAVMNSGADRSFHTFDVKSFPSIFNYIISFILINLIVINSFRVSWINYLNKRQKLTCFWGGFLLLPIQAHLNFVFQDFNITELFSPALGQFVTSSVSFLTLYMFISYFVLLAHLPTATIYDKKMQQISSLHRLSRAVSSEFELDKVVLTTVKLAMEVTEAGFSWLELIEPESGQIKLVSARNLTEKQRKSRHVSFDEPLVLWMKEHKRPFLSNQVSKSSETKLLRKWKRDIHSVICVPLITGETFIGFLYAGSLEEYGFEQDDIDMLMAFSEQVVIAIENSRLIKESIIKERLEQELKIAHDAQMKLLPKEMPQLKGISIEAICKTANEVGGDYFDFFRLDENKLGIVVGDVSGKGPSAAFFMAEIKGIMEAIAKNQSSPKKTLISTNHTFYENIDRNIFITLIYGIIDCETMQFTFCRAGHCPILRTFDGMESVEVLEPGGIAVGLERGPIFSKSIKEHNISLEKGQTLLLYTDGAIEARNKSEQEYGEERLEKSFLSAKNLKSDEIINKLIKDIRFFVGNEKVHDDMTFVIIKT